MGQAFRRAAGRLRTTTIDTSPSPSSSSSTAPFQKSLDQRPPVVTTDSRVYIKENRPTSGLFPFVNLLLLNYTDLFIDDVEWLN